MMHGRLLALQVVFMVGTGAVGGLALGGLADVAGPRSSAVLSGLVCVAVGLWGALAIRRPPYSPGRVDVPETGVWYTVFRPIGRGTSRASGPPNSGRPPVRRRSFARGIHGGCQCCRQHPRRRRRLPGLHAARRRVVHPGLLGVDRAARHRRRLLPDAGRARRRPGHAEDDRDRHGDPGGRAGLPEAAVPDDRRHPGPAGRRRVPHLGGGGRSPTGTDGRSRFAQSGSFRTLAFIARLRHVGPHRLHRHEPGGAGQRAHRGRGQDRLAARRAARWRSAPAAWPACSPSASACSAPPSSS